MSGLRVSARLAPQHVEVLRRGRRVDDPQVVLGAEREEALDPRARVLRSLTLEAVGEQHREAGRLAPLVLGRDDELVDDDLRAVHEVAELRFPADPGLRIRHRVAVLEAERGVLGEHRVVEHERRLVVGDVARAGSTPVSVFVSTSTPWRWLNVPRRVSWPASRTGVPSSTSEPNASASAERPVDVVGVELGAPGVQDLLQLRVDVEVRGPGDERVDDLLERRALHAGRR